MNSHPDLEDPNAEFVIMTDASSVAAGGVLMQWQRKAVFDDTPSNQRPGALETNTQDSFAKQHAKRRAAGYGLKTLGYFSKIFDSVQRR